MSHTETTIVIGGDFTLPPQCTLNERRIWEDVFSDLIQLFQKSDINLINLEGPATNANTKITKYGPHLKSIPEAIPLLSSMGVNAVNLANNHLMDYGEEGYQETINLMEKNGMAYIGAGPSLADASRIKLIRCGNVNLALLGVAESEFSVASRDAPGANPFAHRRILKTMRSVSSDHLVALYHGGLENYPYPTPEQQQRCRYLIDLGAGAVICQHNHVASTYELYKGRLISYGQGNLFSPKKAVSSENSTGYLVSFSADSANLHHRLIPYRIDYPAFTFNFLDNDEADKFLSGLEKMSKHVHDEVYIENMWADKCNERQDALFQAIWHHSSFARFLERNFGMFTGFRKMNELALITNLIRCETHREAVLKALSTKLNQK